MPISGYTGYSDPLDERISGSLLFARGQLEICSIHGVRYQQGRECPGCISSFRRDQDIGRFEPSVSPTASLSLSRVFGNTSEELRRDAYDMRGSYAGGVGSDFRSDAIAAGDTTNYPSRVYHSPPSSYGRSSLHGSEFSDGGDRSGRLSNMPAEDPYDLRGARRSYPTGAYETARAEVDREYGGSSRLSGSGYGEELRGGGGGYDRFDVEREGRRGPGVRGYDDYPDDTQAGNVEYGYEERSRGPRRSFGAYDGERNLGASRESMSTSRVEYPTGSGLGAGRLEQDRYSAY